MDINVNGFLLTAVKLDSVKKSTKNDWIQSQMVQASNQRWIQEHLKN